MHSDKKTGLTISAHAIYERVPSLRGGGLVSYAAEDMERAHQWPPYTSMAAVLSSPGKKKNLEHRGRIPCVSRKTLLYTVTALNLTSYCCVIVIYRNFVISKILLFKQSILQFNDIEVSLYIDHTNTHMQKERKREGRHAECISTDDGQDFQRLYTTK